MKYYTNFVSTYLLTEFFQEPKCDWLNVVFDL